MRNINSSKWFRIRMTVVPHILFKYFKYYNYEVDEKINEINSLIINIFKHFQ